MSKGVVGNDMTTSPNPTQKTLGNKGMLRMGESLPREEHPNWLSNTKWSVLKTHK